MDTALPEHFVLVDLKSKKCHEVKLQSLSVLNPKCIEDAFSSQTVSKIVNPFSVSYGGISNPTIIQEKKEITVVGVVERSINLNIHYGISASHRRSAVNTLAAMIPEVVQYLETPALLPLVRRNDNANADSEIINVEGNAHEMLGTDFLHYIKLFVFTQQGPYKALSDIVYGVVNASGVIHGFPMFNTYDDGHMCTGNAFGNLSSGDMRIYPQDPAYSASAAMSKLYPTFEAAGYNRDLLRHQTVLYWARNAEGTAWLLSTESRRKLLFEMTKESALFAPWTFI